MSPEEQRNILRKDDVVAVGFISFFIGIMITIPISLITLTIFLLFGYSYKTCIFCITAEYLLIPTFFAYKTIISENFKEKR